MKNLRTQPSEGTFPVVQNLTNPTLSRVFLMTYVSARFAQADPGIVSGSTIERNKMSTKTIYKRIALVAVAALGMGVLTSVAPASAATNTKIFCDLADGLSNQSAPSATNDVCNGVAGPANFVRLEWHGSPAAGDRLTISGAGATFSDASDTANVSVPLNGLTATVLADSTDETIQVNTPTAGTVTVSLFAAPTGGVYSTTPVETVVITVNAAKVSGSIDLATSTTYLNKAATITAATTETTSFTASATANTSGTPVFAAIVTLGQVAGAITTTTKVEVSLTGPGTLSLSADDADPTDTAIATGRSLTSTVATTGEVFTVGVAPDGVAGVSVLTIKAGTYTSTRTITFSGVVTSLAFTPVAGSIIDTADGVLTGDTDSYAGVITGKDAAGNAVTLVAGDFTAPTAAEKTAAVITNAAVVAATAGTYSGVVVAGSAPVVVIDPTATKTGAKTLTLKHTATGLTVAVPFVVGLERATTVTLTTDKASYLPGEKIVLTLTATAGGVAIADISAATDLLASGGISSSVSIAGDATTATNPALVAGKKSWTLYAPLTSGPITFTGKTGATSGTYAPSAAVVSLTATATVTDSASMSAITTLINSLIAKINALNKLVIKIQKKVRA
jgi:trimeric autotransporter adhesin